MEQDRNPVYPNTERRINLNEMMGKRKGRIYSALCLLLICVLWYFLAKAINKSLVLPDFVETMAAFFTNWVNPDVMSNLFLTLKRVFTGCLYSVLIGLPIGLLMGVSKTASEIIAPFVNSVRQVPIMAWVPLSIIWFGLGDGPTVFMITMSAVFPLIINTIAGVMGIDPNYKYAARSMGASTAQVIRDIVIPGATPSFLTGFRLALSQAWMSVICAEFIATSAGFGFLMVEAQVRMETPQLYALMIMAAIVGFAMDKLVLIVERYATAWRFKNGDADNG